jgi:iron complex transport system ATP-binding protein
MSIPTQSPAEPVLAPERQPPLLDMRNVTVLRDGRRLLDCVSLAIEQGCHTALLGANGSGKSTLVKLIERRMYPLARDPDGGAVRMRLFGRERWDVTALRKWLGVVSAERQAALAGDTAVLSAFDVVVSGFFASHGLALDMRASDWQMQEAERALTLMGVAHLAKRTLFTLSTGEARRVMIARALVHRPRALLLDEPCAGLDMVARQQFLERLRGIVQTGTTLLLVTHHVEEIIPEIGHVVMLQGGRVAAAGEKGALLDSARLSDLFGAEIVLSRRGDWYDAKLRR